MIRCRLCVMPLTRPDLHFIDGICSACISYAARPRIDWEARKQELIALLDRHDGRCIVPSSGGKDSHYQVLTLLKLGANPTIVTASTCQLSNTGRRNIDNLGRYAPTTEFSPNRTQRAKLNRIGLEMVGDISWPEHVAIFTVPFNAALSLGVSLIFYGENPQDQYGGPPGSEKATVMTRRWVSEFGGFLGLRPSDLEAQAGRMAYYQPPNPADIEAAGIEAHFLGQYLPWDSHENARVAVEAGMRTRLPCDANLWEHENLDNLQTGIHDHMMFRKYGYGRGCAQISVDIRAGLVTREDALDWVKDSDGLFPDDYMGTEYRQVLEHIGMSEEHFATTMDQFTNWDIVEKRPGGRIVVRA